MKTFWSILGGLTTVGGFAALLYGAVVSPHVVDFVVLGFCMIVIVSVLFYLGYTFVRDVIIGRDML